MPYEFKVHIVDDDDAVRDSLVELLDSVGIEAIAFESADVFLRDLRADSIGCLVLDIRMPGMSGLDLQRKLQEIGSSLPVIFVTGHADIPMAVEAIKRGAVDFIQKPFREQELLDCIQATMKTLQQSHDSHEQKKAALQRLGSLTGREREVLDLLSEGHPNKVIADKMGISQRTVENHRARVLEKMGARSSAALIKVLVLANSTV